METTLQDIKTRKDIEFLIDTFYTEVLKDDLIKVFFTEVLPLDFDQHLPKMCDFWESILFGISKYSGNPMQKHLALHDLKTLKPEHFERWLQLWETTLTTQFSGKKADEALVRATHIGKMINVKVGNTHF